MSDPAAPPTPGRSEGPIRCEFCHSTLSARGEVLGRGERALALMQSEETAAAARRDLDVATSELAAARAELAEIKRELDALKTGAAPSGRRSYRPLFERD